MPLLSNSLPLSLLSLFLISLSFPTIALSQSSPQANLPTGNFTSSNPEFEAFWFVSPENQTISITFSAPTLGWVAIGWSNLGPHSNTESIFCWVDESGMANAVDAYSLSRTRPDQDPQQDILSVQATEENGVTTCTITRMLETDDDRDVDIQTSQLVLVYAYQSFSDSINQRHSSRGFVGVNFFTGEITELSSFQAGVILIIVVIGWIFLYALLRLIVSLFAEWKHKSDLKEISGLEKDQVELPSFDRASTSPELKAKYLPPPVVVAAEVTPRSSSSSSPSESEEDEEKEKNSPQITVTDPSPDPSPIVGADEIIESHHQGPAEEVTEDYEIPIATGHIHKGSHSFRWLTAISHSRIPWSQIYVLDFLGFGLYVALHFALAYGVPLGSTPASNIWGSLAAANAVFLMATAVRNSFLGLLVGWTWPRILQFHRWLGRWTALTILIHWVSFFREWQENDEFAERTSEMANIFGIIALGLTLFQWLESVEFVRRKVYEWFYLFHFGFVAFYVFAGMHRSSVVPYVIAASGIYAIEVSLRLFWTLWPRKTHDIEVFDDIARFRMPRHFAARYKPGQYVLLNFPSVSLFEWHPFTLTSGAHEKHLEVYIRGLGNFSKRIVKQAAERVESGAPMWIRIDGPYGRLQFSYKQYPNLVLAGAGIGVTPIISILKTVYKIDTNQHEEGEKFAAPSMIGTIFLVWTVREASQLLLFTELIAAITQKAGKNSYPKFVPVVNVSGVVSTSTTPRTSIKSPSKKRDLSSFLTSIQTDKNPVDLPTVESNAPIMVQSQGIPDNQTKNKDSSDDNNSDDNNSDDNNSDDNNSDDNNSDDNNSDDNNSDDNNSGNNASSLFKEQQSKENLADSTNQPRRDDEDEHTSIDQESQTINHSVALSTFETNTGIATRKGRPNLNLVVTNIFNTIAKQATTPKGERTAVLACGPGKFVKSIWDNTNKANAKRALSVDFHHETFKF